MKVKLLYFAVLRDIVGKSESDVEVPDGTRPADLWQRLRAEHRQLAAYAQPPMTAVNESYVRPDSVLRDGDEVAFIPPVAGG
jgi:molybdopterin converting factor subunit 1